MKPLLILCKGVTSTYTEGIMPQALKLHTSQFHKNVQTLVTQLDIGQFQSPVYVYKKGCHLKTNVKLEQMQYMTTTA